jgi:U3 small nucleolar RNA-associated protein 21
LLWVFCEEDVILMMISLDSTLIYRFSSVGGPITVLAQSPVLDVVAIGLVDGSVILYNLKMDKALLRFQQEGRVTAIAFRTGGWFCLSVEDVVGEGGLTWYTLDEDEQQMVSTNGEGDMSFWDLAEGRLAHLMAGAHDGEITAAAFLPGKPVLITSGSDNAVRVGFFSLCLSFGVRVGMLTRRDNP